MKMYFIAIVLPDELNNKILHWKNFMFEKYGCRVGLKSPAHITLIPPFWMPEEKERELINDIDLINSSTSPFTISVNNFSAFNPKTIYADVEVNENLLSLKETVDNFFSKKDYNLKSQARPFHPHITIATRDLHKKDFHEAWPVFETKKLSAEFEVKGICILKHDSVRWEVIAGNNKS